ncbi:MAG: hypothetical protein EGR97_13000 [Clostridiales bacterium]|jgi:chromosome segregation ATPase|nr:hypothetical protein [Clostridiales bacterium]
MIKFLRPRSENMREVVMVLCDALNRIENYVREQETQRAASAASLSALAADIKLLRGDVESLSAELDTLTATVPGLEKRIADAEDDIRDIFSQI